MNFGQPYYGDFNAMQQQRQSNQSNWSKGWDTSHRSAFQNYLVGRLVFSPDQITPQEIPTDGTPAIFPLDDRSAIYVKSIKPDGSGFAEYRYVLDKPVEIEKNMPQPCEVGTTNVLNVVDKQTSYDDLVKRIDFLEQVVNELLKNPSKSDQKEGNKEVENNG